MRLDHSLLQNCFSSDKFSQHLVWIALLRSFLSISIGLGSGFRLGHSKKWILCLWGHFVVNLLQHIGSFSHCIMQLQLEYSHPDIILLNINGTLYWSWEIFLGQLHRHTATIRFLCFMQEHLDMWPGATGSWITDFGGSWMTELLLPCSIYFYYYLKLVCFMNIARLS